MSIAFIGLGSNLGSGPLNLIHAWELLVQSPEISSSTFSSPYRTSPVNIASDNWFTNAVGKVITSLEPDRLLAKLLEIEREMGRDRRQGDDRIIDLDILYYDNLIRTENDLILPHPELHTRLFVLQPLVEIAPDHCHPVFNKTSLELLQEIDAPDQKIEKLIWPTQEN